MSAARRSSLVLHLAFALLLVAPPGAAQLTPKEAAAQLKAVTKQALKDFKAEVGIAAGQLQGAIKLFELDIDELDTSDAPLDALATALIAYQTSVRDAWGQAEQAAAQAAAGLVGQVLDGGSAPSDAAGLARGDGGALDDLGAALESAARKSRDKLAKRLEKAVKKAEAGSVMDVRVRLDVPVPPPPLAPGDGTVTPFGSDELSIDLLLAASREDGANEALLWASGTADDTLGLVLLLYEGAGLPLMIMPSDNRWVASGDFGGGVLPLVNLVIIVAQGNDGISVAKTIGVP